jgi:Tfp pilus assembly protein PilO
MQLATVAAFTWPDAAALLGVLVAAMVLVAAYVELRKTKLRAAQEDDLRQLVRRYEQLAETTLDAQQRAAADLSELRSRTTSIKRSFARSTEDDRKEASPYSRPRSSRASPDRSTCS